MNERMNWYKVWIVVPGTDGDAENGPCEPTWWNDYVKAASEEEAVRTANEKCKADFEEADEFGLCEKDMGGECPVCTGAAKATDEEYEAWKKEMDEIPELPFI